MVGEEEGGREMGDKDNDLEEDCRKDRKRSYLVRKRQVVLVVVEEEGVRGGVNVAIQCMFLCWVVLL